MKFGKNKSFLYNIKTVEDAKLAIRMIERRVIDFAFLSSKGKHLLYVMAYQAEPLNRWGRKVLGKRHPLVLDGTLKWRDAHKKRPVLGVVK